MTGADIKIDLGGVEETLLLPLWTRARDTERPRPILNDVYARKMVERIDYDFSRMEAGLEESHQLVWPVRAFNFDTSIRQWLAAEEKSMVVNLGAGLDTTFQRVDDGSLLWINIDLPAVVSLRRQLIPDSEREINLAGSILDFSWMDEVRSRLEDRSLLFTAAGILCYFSAAEVKSLLLKMADVFPEDHLIFDAMSRLTVWGANREIMKKSGMDRSARLKWHLKRASSLCRWLKSLIIVEEYPMFSKVSLGQGWSKRLLRDMRIADRLHLYNMVHVRL